MPHTIEPRRKNQAIPSFHELLAPVYRILPHTPPLGTKGNRPLQMTFDQQLKALIFYHLEEHSSGSHLVQVLEKDNFAMSEIATPKGIQKSSFFEAIHHRGPEQLLYIFEKLQADTAHTLPNEYAHLGYLVSIDGSLIDAVLSMHWADYRDGSKKAKVHLGFNINHAEAAKAICDEDDEVDKLYDQVYRELLTFMIEDSKTITRATYLIWAVHNLERIADRVKIYLRTHSLSCYGNNG